MANIVNVGYDSTNYYVVGPSDARLLIDVGFPGTLPRFLATLRRKGVPLEAIRYVLATHYHPDHAGLIQELKGRGVRLIVLEPQIPAIPRLRSFMKPAMSYIDITLDDIIRLAVGDSRAFLRGIGVGGAIIGTPGHSDDSVSLVLDDGAAFTGDLPPPNGDGEVERSWGAVRALGATVIYPGHGPARPLPPAAG